VKPILFNTEMVRAILDGRKTQTRRVIKVPPTARLTGIGGGQADFEWRQKMKNADIVLDKYKDVGFPYQPGDILYVRETWSTRPSDHCYAQPCHGSQCPYPSCDSADGPCFPDEYIYKASDNLPECGGKWHPSIHMPKAAARIFLRVTDVRAERLQHITRDGAISEGCNAAIPILGFKRIWNSTIKPADHDGYDWDANPWVWVISFESCERPEAKL